MHRRQRQPFRGSSRYRFLLLFAIVMTAELRGKAREVRYVRATSVDHAVARVEAGAVPLAGGSSLVPGVARGDVDGELVDIGGLVELTGVRAERSPTRAGEMAVDAGALVTIAALVDGELGRGCGAVADTARAFGSPYVRATATLGGSLASARSTMWPALLVLDARVTLHRAKGATSLAANEIARGGLPARSLVTRVTWTVSEGLRSAAVVVSPRGDGTEGQAVIACAVDLVGGVVSSARVAVGGLGAVRRLPGIEAEVVHGGLGVASVDEIARRAGEGFGVARGEGISLALARGIVRRGVADVLRKVSPP